MVYLCDALLFSFVFTPVENGLKRIDWLFVFELIVRRFHTPETAARKGRLGCLRGAGARGGRLHDAS